MRLFLAAVFLFAPRVATAGQQKRAEELGDWGRPRILFQESQRKMHHRWKCLAFANDSKTLVGSAVSKTGAMVLLQQSNGVVYSFDLSAAHPTPRRIADAWNQDIDIVKTPTGVCPDRLLVVRWVYHKPKEVVVDTIVDGKSDEQSLQRIPIRLPDDYRWNTLQIRSAALLFPTDTLVFGKALLERDKDRPFSGEVVAWDRRAAKASSTDEWKDGQVLSVACSADGKWVAAGGHRYVPAYFEVNRYKGRVVCWDQAFQDKYFDLVLDKVAQSLVFAPDGKTLVVGQWKGTIEWIDLQKKEVVKSVNILPFSGKASGRIACMAFSPDGKTLAVGAGSWEIGYKWGQTFLIDVPSGRVQAPRDCNEEHVVTCVALSPDGKSLAAGAANGVLKCWQRGADVEQTHDDRPQAVRQSLTYTPRTT